MTQYHLAIGVSVVLDNVRKVTAGDAEFDPQEQFEHSAADIDRLATPGCEIVRRLYARDRQSESEGGLSR